MTSPAEHGSFDWVNPAFYAGFKMSTIPALCMMAGSLAVILSPGIPNTIKTASQNLSAGLLISVISGELWPVLIGSDGPDGGTMHYGGLVGGFTIGLITMYALKELFPEDDDDEDEDETDEETGGEDGHSLNKMGVPPARPLEFRDFSEVDFKVDLKTMDRLVAQLQEESGSRAHRDVIDRLIHELEFSCDLARRHLIGTRPFSDSAKKRIREHISHLYELLTNLNEKARIADPSSVDKALAAFEKMIAHVHDHAHRQRRFRRYGGTALLNMSTGRIGFSSGKSSAVVTDSIPLSNGEAHVHTSPRRRSKVPWSMVVAVIVDSFNDGLLIGLSCAVSYKAGLTMAAATCIEMGFLGFSFTAQLAGTRLSQRDVVILSVVPALTMISAGAAGSSLGSMSKSHPEFFVGFVAFSVVALLFVVVHELLAEAIEMREINELWYVNICIFVGLFLGLIIEKAGSD